VLDPEARGVDRLCGVLERHGYLGPEARDVLGVPLGTEPLRLDLPLFERRLVSSRPLHTLVKLFGLFLDVTEEEARSAFAPLSVDEVAAMGLVEREEGRVRPSVGLVAVGGMVVARDRYDERRGALNPDHVLGVNPPAMLLAHLTARRSVRRTLDLGCGGGIQALLAASHSERVTAADINPRALLFTRFSARLNGVQNVECRQGDFFGAVPGERFDLVVCNPPYVVSPDNNFAFRDAGRPGICEEIIRRTPDFLEEGGFATILCNWPLTEGEAWADPPSRWVEGTPCDAWILLGDAQDPLGYAAVWNRSGDASSYAAALDRWLAYYRERRFASIAMGAIVLRRRSGGSSWVRADELSGKPVGPCGEQIQRIFAAQDAIGGLADDAVLARAYRLADDQRLHQALALRDGQLVVEDAELRLDGGLGFRGTVDAFALQLLRRCDGRRPLAEIVAELTRGSGQEAASLRRAVAAAVRRLAGLGFLIPGSGEERRTDGSKREYSQEADAPAARVLRADGSARPGGGA
jgi:2-polyprenyl-3-methyl-5-hydroxy-6-metoxy-1,4-benzoquinol methylase